MDFFWEQLNILSVAFYVFLVPVAILYFTLAKKFSFQWIVLLCVSVFFYFANGGIAGLWIFVPLAVTYSAAFACQNGKRPFLAALTVVFNILFLVFFKELNFFIRIFDKILSALSVPQIGEVGFEAPFGISYISLMLTSYFLDVFWGVCPLQKNPLRFASSVIFFPITTSGPIARYSQMKESLFEPHAFQYQDFCFGLERILWGFMKKMVIADRLALLVGFAYADKSLTGTPVLLGLFLFTFQLYFDFSGCMDIVIGLGEALGIKIPENFMQPFFSESLSEIWRRWHATLGNWARDYILYPFLKSGSVQSLGARLKSSLGKKNFWAKNIPTWLGMFIVWFCMGFWHGGSWNYIFGSGLFFFAMITAGQILDHFLEKVPFFAKISGLEGMKIFRRIRTTALFAASISFDRAPSLTEGFLMWKRAFVPSADYFWKSFVPSGFLAADFWVLSVFVPLVFFVERYEFFSQASNDNTASFRKMLSKKNVIIRHVFFLLILLSVVIFGMYGPEFDAKGFIYGGF